MENEKENKFLFILAVTLLAILILMVFVKIFIFDKNKEKITEVPESLIKELYSYLDVKNVNNEASFYLSEYIDSQNLSWSTISRVTYNYINKYDNLKIKSVDENDKKDFKENGTLISKIKITEFKDEILHIFKKTNLNLDEHFNRFDIDENTSAIVNTDYLFIYKRNEPIENNFIYYRGLTSYTLLDDLNKIQITEYYLACNKETKYCYDNDRYDKIANGITYVEGLDASTMTNRLKKYVHTFEKIDGNYKWINIESA